jgi:hypothetical protein
MFTAPNKSININYSVRPEQKNIAGRGCQVKRRYFQIQQQQRAILYVNIQSIIQFIASLCPCLRTYDGDTFNVDNLKFRVIMKLS